MQIIASIDGRKPGAYRLSIAVNEPGFPTRLYVAGPYAYRQRAEHMQTLVPQLLSGRSHVDEDDIRLAIRHAEATPTYEFQGNVPVRIG